MSTRSPRRITAGAAVYLAVGTLQRGYQLLLLPFITRVMPPEEYGAVSLVIAVAMLFSALFGGPVETAVFRAASRNDANSLAGLLAAARIYSIGVVPLGATVAAGVLFWTSPSLLGVDGEVVGIELLSVALLGAMTYFVLPLVQARDQLQRYVVVAAVWIVVTASAKLALLNLYPTVEGWVYSDLVSSSVTFIMALVLASRERTTLLADWRSLCTFALPLMPHRVAFWSLGSLSRPVVVAVSGLAAAGIFSLALNIAAAASMVLGELNRAVLIEYAREYFPAPGRLTQRVAQMQILAAIVVPILISIGLWKFSSILGEDYSSAVPLASILLMGQMAYGVYVVPMNLLVHTAGQTKWSWVPSVCGASVIALLTLLLGSRVSLYAIAGFHVAGYWVMLFTVFVVVRTARLQTLWGQVFRLPCTIWFLAIAGATASVAVSFGTNHRYTDAIALFAALMPFLALWMFWRKVKPRV